MKRIKQICETVNLILLSTIEYNKAIQSVTNKKPIVIILSSTKGGLQVTDRIENAQ